MLNRNDLMPGDLLLFKGENLLANLIGWFEWRAGRSHPQYRHAAIVYDDLQFAEMGGTATDAKAVMRKLDELEPEYESIDVFRVMKSGGGLGEIEFPAFIDLDAAKRLQESIGNNLGQKYAYVSQIGRQLVLGLAERIGFREWVKKREAQDANKTSTRDVCSTFAEERIYDGLGGIDLWPSYGLNRVPPAGLPDGQAGEFRVVHVS